MRIKYLFILLVSLLSYRLDAQNLSGTDFWFTIPENTSFSSGGGNNEVFIVSQYCIDSAFIDIPVYNQRIYFSVEPGNFNRVVIPPRQNGVEAWVDVTGFNGDLNAVAEKGIHISSPLPISVYYLNSAPAVSDGESILPTRMLGTQYVMAMRNNGLSKCDRNDPPANNYGYVTATEDATDVTIQTWNNFGPVTYNITLNAGEVYSWATGNNCAGDYPWAPDMTCLGMSGSVVTATKKVVVMAGAPCATIGVAGNCDMLMSTYLPVNLHESFYVITQTQFRDQKVASSTIGGNECFNDDLKGSGDYVEITGRIGDQVQITSRSGVTIETINAPGGTAINYGYGSVMVEMPEALPDDFGEANMTIRALDNPVQVNQYNKGRHADDVDIDQFDPADPEVLLVLPPSTWEDSYFFYPIRSSSAETQEIVLVVEDVGNPSPTTTFEINDQPVTDPFLPIPNTNYKFVRQSFPDFEASKVTNTSGAKFGLYFFARGTRETAFFSGGYGPIQDLNLCDQCGAIDILLSGSTCFGDSITFEPRIYTFTRPSTLNFLWNFGDGTTSTEEFPKKKYASTGTFKVRLQVSGTGGCLLRSEKTVYINEVETNPESDPDTLCLGAMATLKPNFNLIPGGNQVVQYKNTEDTLIPIPDAGVNTFWDGSLGFNQVASSFVQVDGIYINPGRIDSVCINLDHDLISDINLFLISPTGVRYELLTSPVSNGRTNLRKTCFTATATENIVDAFPPYTGSYTTESGAYPNPMTSPAINGAWELRIGDESTNFSGDLVDWSMYISSDIGINEFVWSPDIDPADVDLLTGQVEVAPDTTKTYYIEVSDYAGCLSRDSVKVQVERLPVLFDSRDTLLCNIYDDFSLFNTLNDARPRGDGTWEILNGDPALLTNGSFDTRGIPAGDYNFKYTEEIFCGRDSALVTVSVNELPFLGTNAVDTICDSEADQNLFPYLGAGVTPGGIWTSMPELDLTAFDAGNLSPNNTPEDNYFFFYKRPVEGCPLDSSYVNLQVNHQPYAGTDGDTLVCESGVPLNLLTVLNDNPEATGKWTDTDNSGGLDKNLFRGINTPTNPNSSIFRFAYEIKAKKACVDANATATVTVSAAPEATLTADFPILCKDSTVNLTVNLEGNGPFNLEVSDGVNTFPAPGVNPVASGIVISTPLNDITTYTVTKLTDNTALKCPVVKPASLTVEVYEPIQAKLVEERCILNSDGITFDGFIPVIELTGGDGTNYRYDLFIDDVLVKSDVSAPSATHSRDTLPNGVEYSYKFYDGSNCPDLEAVFTRKPRKYCECETFVGTMDIAPLEFCEYETAVAPVVTNSFLEPEDTVYYILHDKAGIVLGNRLDSNATPNFNYQPSLQYEKTYYISAIAGDSLLGGIDPQDTCVSVSDGTPIVFHQTPDVAFATAGGAICEGDIFELPFEMTGTGPFRLIGERTDADGTTALNFPFLPDSGSINLNPLKSAVYRFNQIIDGNTQSCVKALAIDIAVDVFDLPRVSFDHGNEVAICEGTDFDLRVNINGGTGPYRIEFLKDGAAFGAPVITSNNTYLLNITEQGRYQINSIQDVGANCRGLVTNGTVQVLVKKQPIANAGASPIEVCGKIVGLKAKPSFGTGRWQVPASGYNYSSPNRSETFAIVPGNGEYTFIWEEENAPCPISRDTVFAEFFTKPVADAGPDSLFCGTEATLYANPSLSSSEGGGFWIYDGPGTVNFNNASSPNAEVSVAASGSYNLIWREEVPGKCVDFDTVNIVFSDFLRAAVIDTICLDNGNKYQFVININGGDPNSLTVNGKLIGSLPYVTPPLNSGESYKFGFSDLSSCGYSDTLRTRYGCPCISDAGALQNQDTLKLCFGDKLIAQSIQDFTKDSDDTLLYILHTRSDDTLGGILASSGINGLNTDNLQLTPGKVYYLSRVVGTKANNNLGLNTNDYCLSVTPGMPVTFNKKAQAIISLTSQVCEGEDLILKVNGGGVGPYTFSLRDTPGGAGTMYSVNSGDELNLNYPVGNYTFYISNFVDQGNPCTELLNDRLNASVKPLPSGDVMFEPIVCRFTSTLFEVRNTQARVTWDFGDGSELVEGKTAGHTYTAAGNYVVTTTLVDKVTGCLREYTNAITVQRKPDVRILVDGTLDFDGVKCPGENAFISLATFDPSTTYQWFVNGVERTPFTTAFLQALGQESIQIKLKATTTGGCIDESTVTIKVANPVAELQLPNEVCNRDELTLRFRDANQHVDTYQWTVLGSDIDNYDGNPVTFMVDEPAGTNILQVRLELTSKEGCVNTLSKDVRVKQVLADFIAPTEICLNETATILNNAVNVKKLRYTFGDGSASTVQTTIQKRYAQPGLYTITQTVENQEEGCSDVVQKQIRVNGLPKVQDYNFEVCANTLDTLRISGGEFYNWEPATFLNQNFGDEVLFSAITDSLPQTRDYLVRVTNTQNCTDTSYVTVNIVGLDSNVVFPFGIDTLVTIGDSFKYALPDVPGLIYDWTPEELFDCVSCPTQTLYGIEETEYLINVTDIFGCTDRAIRLRVRVNEEPKSLDVPDAFTPNGDGINDEIFPQGWGVEEYESFRIYNRYGELIFEGSGSKPAWNGLIEDEPAAAGTYVFVVRAKMFNQRKRQVLQGSFMLIR